MSRTTARRLLLATSWAWLSTSCAGDKGGDTATREPACSDWAGLVNSKGWTNLERDFVALDPPHEESELNTHTSLDSATGAFTVQIDLDSWTAGSGSTEFDTMYSAVGRVTGTCDERGLFIHERVLTWFIYDPFGRWFDLRPSATTTWTPPLQLLPANPEVGDRWLTHSTQLTTSATGQVVAETVQNEYEITGIETLDRSYIGQLDALVVQDATGHRTYFARGYGLIRGAGLVRRSDGDCLACD